MRTGRIQIGHHFKGDGLDETHDETRLGGGAHLNLLTLRTADIAGIEHEVLALGMTPLRVQQVSSFGFTLYTYSFTEETSPNLNLQSVETAPGSTAAPVRS